MIDIVSGVFVSGDNTSSCHLSLQIKKVLTFHSLQIDLSIKRLCDLTMYRMVEIYWPCNY